MSIQRFDDHRSTQKTFWSSQLQVTSLAHGPFDLYHIVTGLVGHMQMRLSARHTHSGFAAKMFVRLPIQSYRSILLSSLPRDRPIFPLISILSEAHAIKADVAAAAAALPLLSGTLQGIDTPDSLSEMLIGAGERIEDNGLGFNPAVGNIL